MRIAYFGSGDFGIQCLNALRNSNHSVEFIVTQPPRAAGRGRITTPTDVALWARQNQIPFLETDNASQPAVVKQIADLNPDLILVIAFGQKISDELIALPPKGMINVHSSLLPKYRGAAPINWAIINGETETGVTIATVTSHWDAGDIIAQTKTSIKPDENAEQLSERLSALVAPMLIETLEKINDGTAVYTKQDKTKATRAPKLKKSDAFLDLSLTAVAIRNMIRGFWPWPGAAAMYISKNSDKKVRVTIAAADIEQNLNPRNLTPGTLDDNLDIICGSGALKIKELKPAGRSKMTFQEFVNGYRVAALDKFTKIEK